MFYSMRTALQDDAARLYAPDMRAPDTGKFAPALSTSYPADSFDPRGFDPRASARSLDRSTGSVEVGTDPGAAQPWVPASAARLGESRAAATWPPRRDESGDLGQSLP